MDKVLTKLNQTRQNWWQAFQLGINLKGYTYYQPPKEIKYRYPAPGSVAQDTQSYPHLFKSHWKTPYRESNYNIQKKEKRTSPLEEFDYYVAEKPQLDPNDYIHAGILHDQIPDYSNYKLMNNDQDKSYEEKRDELWQVFESTEKMMNEHNHNNCPWEWDLDQEYFPRQTQFRERGFSGFENDAIGREVIVEAEYLVEKVYGAQRI